VGGLANLWFALSGAAPGMLWFLLLLTGFFCGGSFPLYLSLVPSETVPFALAGLAIGIPTGVGELVGSGILPTIGGIIADTYGLRAAMLLAAVSALVATIFALFIIETAPRKKRIATTAAG